MEIVIDWEKLSSIDEFYDFFLPQVSAPEWHGRNLNALQDSIVTGDVNKIEPPYTIKNINSISLAQGLNEFQAGVFEIFKDAQNSGRKINVIIE